MIHIHASNACKNKGHCILQQNLFFNVVLIVGASSLNHTILKPDTTLEQML